MKDFPIFTTEHGAASLILKEIPYRKEAYIHLQSSKEPLALLEDCISFCRICGAESIFASGNSVLETYPLHTAILEMHGQLSLSEDEIPNMFPVTDATITKWRQIYNQKMRSIDNASTLESRDESRILNSGGAYFVHVNGNLLGIGWLEGNHISAVASLAPKAGEKVCKALQSIIPQENLQLEVASSNQKAIELYERLGFIKVCEKSRWYRVI